jgi:putative oxidoreductase
MEKINDFFDGVANPIRGVADWLLRIGLGIAFFLHGYGKLPISDGFVGWLGSKGVPMAELTAYLVAWGEILAGLGIIVGGIIANSLSELGHLITRVSGGAIGVIMIFALLIAHSDWGIFFGERGSVLFASEQLFLLLLGTYFSIKGNK